MMCGPLQIERFLQIARGVFKLLQVKLGEPGNLPGFRIVWIRGGDLSSLFRRGRILFLLQELISVICIQRNRGIANRRGRFHVEQRRVPVSCGR